MERWRVEAFDKMIGDTLAQAPTTKQNLDSLARIEDDMRDELEQEVKARWITTDEADIALRALHERIYPTAVSPPQP